MVAFVGIGTPPSLTSADAHSATKVRAYFSEPMRPDGLSTAANYTISEDMGSNPVLVVSADPEVNPFPLWADLTLDAPMSEGVANYELEVDASFRDKAGNAIDVVSVDFDGTPETEQCQKAISRLPRQFLASQKFRALLCIYADQAQAFIDLANQVRDRRMAYDLAEGLQLTYLARDDGLERNALDDPTLRLLLEAFALACNAPDHPDDLIEIVRTVWPLLTHHYTEDYPAGWRHEVDEPVDYVVGAMVAKMLHLADPSGVHGYLVFHEVEPAERFTYGGAAGTGYGEGILSHAR